MYPCPTDERDIKPGLLVVVLLGVEPSQRFVRAPIEHEMGLKEASKQPKKIVAVLRAWLTA